MKYFEIIKIVDETFPSTVDFDYRTITPNEMWDRIVSLLKDVDIYRRIPEEKLIGLENVTTQWFTPVHENKSFIVGRGYNGEDVSDYDQYNQYIKRNVLYIKNYVMDAIKEYGNFSSTLSSYYTVEKTGSVDEIEEHLNPESIKEYITKLFMVSKENNDLYDNDLLIAEINNDIEYHYGIDLNLEGKSLIRKQFERAAKDATSYSGGTMKLDGMLMHESVSQDQSIFRSVIGKYVDEIVEYVTKITNEKLQYLKECEKRRIEYEKEDEQNTISEEVQTESYYEEEKEDEFGTPVIEGSKRVVKSEIEQAETPTITDNFAETIANYNRLQKVIARQKEIIKQLQELDKERKSLVEEFTNNAEEIRKGAGNGI